MFYELIYICQNETLITDRAAGADGNLRLFKVKVDKSEEDKMSISEKWAFNNTSPAHL